VAHVQYVRWCHQNGIQDVCEQWHEHSFGKNLGRWPCLKSPKAAEQRWLTVWLHAVLCSIPAPGHMESLLKMAYIAMVEFDILCRENGRHFTDEALAKLDEAGETFLYAYNALALYACCLGIFLFKVKPKLHMFCHMFREMARVANPRRVQAYMDESVIGKLKKIAAACHPDAISHRVVERWVLWMALRLHVLALELHGLVQ